MKPGKVETYINEIIDAGKGVFMFLLDPDKQQPDDALALAKDAAAGGADIILLGGSIGVQGPVLEETAKLIKEHIDLPLHLFPGNVGNITSHADSIYFMSLLNSTNPYWISGAQTLGAGVVKRLGIEAIPTAYLVFEPGQTVGWVGEDNLLPRSKPDLAVAFSLSAEYLGMRFAILESGSGAPSPVPTDIVKAIRAQADLRLVIAGGVKTPAQARELIEAGANAIHIGTSIENASNVREKARKFADAIHLK